MKNYLTRKGKFTGTGHVLGRGDAPPPPEEAASGEALLAKLEAKKQKKPAKVGLTEHLQKLESERKNAPLQFCQDVPSPPVPPEDESVFETAISLLLSHGDGVEDSVTLLRRVLRNLILRPTEAKFRRLNLTNVKVQEGLMKVAGALEFMTLCGFEQNEEQLIYGDSDAMERPRRGLTHLNRHFPEPPPPPVPTASQSPPATVVPENDVPRRDRRTQLLLLKPTEVTVPEWFFERTSAEVKAEYFAMVKQKELDQTFMTRQQRERIKAPLKQYTFTVLRVRLPEGVLLQGEFDGGESVVRVHEWISEQLRDVGRPFELVLPSRAKLGLKGTLRQNELLPATLLSFHWSDGLDTVQREPTVIDTLVTSAVIDWDNATVHFD